MAATLFKEVGYSISKLIAEVDSGEIGLPDIQRPFVWSNSKVRDLFDSMYNGFPVGYLLFWANATGQNTRQIGTDGKQAVARLLIVDGQQRLTALFAVIKGVPVVDDNYQERRIQIAFRPRDQHFAVADAATLRDPEFINDITDLWAGTLSRTRFVKAFLIKLRETREVSDDEEDELSESIDQLYDVQSYPFTALELAPNVSAEKVADVFVRINSKGVPLNQADFILTLMSVFWDSGRRELEQFARAAKSATATGPSPFNHFIQPSPDQMLRVGVGLAFRRGRLSAVYSLLRGRDVETGRYSVAQREKQFAQLQEAQNYALDLTNWHEFLKTLMRAGFRSSRMLTAHGNLLFSYVIYLIGKRDFKVEPNQLREVVAQWFFMSSLTSRYRSEGDLEADLANLRKLSTADEFLATLNQVIRDQLTNDFWEIALPNALATSSPRSPSLFAYYASLNLLNAQVLFSRLRVPELFDPALRAKKSALERHHLFPRAYLKSVGITSTPEVNQIANYALVEWPDNIAISGAPPIEYFPKFVQRLSPAERKHMSFWHALPAGWESMDYEAFLEARRKLIAKVVRAGFERLVAGDESPETTPDELDVKALIARGESARLEFKASARWNLRKGGRDANMEQTIVKTVASFMNRHGGTLLIGVNNDREVIGLENDYKLLRIKDADGFELWLTDLCMTHLGKTATTGLAVAFERIDEKDVCRVDVSASPKPVFVRSKTGKGQPTADFFVRMGNSTRPYNTAEVLEYVKDWWGEH